jgi:hypothetical protein
MGTGGAQGITQRGRDATFPSAVGHVDSELFRFKQMLATAFIAICCIDGHAGNSTGLDQSQSN